MLHKHREKILGALSQRQGKWISKDFRKWHLTRTNLNAGSTASNKWWNKIAWIRIWVLWEHTQWPGFSLYKGRGWRTWDEGRKSGSTKQNNSLLSIYCVRALLLNLWDETSKIHGHVEFTTCKDHGYQNVNFSLCSWQTKTWFYMTTMVFFHFQTSSQVEVFVLCPV